MAGLVWMPRALGEASVPANFSWPSAQEYAQHTSAALANVKDVGFATMVSDVIPTSDIGKTILTASAGGHQQVITTILETAIGKGIDLAGSQGLTPVLTSKFLNCMQDALNGNIEGAVIGGVQLAAQVASALSAIPIMGQIAGMVCNWIRMIFDAQGIVAEATHAAEQDCRDSLIPLCDSAIQNGIAHPTGIEGPTPSDMFRGHLYAYRTGSAPPLNVASMYLALCGGETQGFGMSRATYNSIMGQVRAQYGNEIGIRPEVQRTMWKLIKGIIFAAEDPSIRSDLTSIGDGGRSLFPILQDIVRNEYLRFKNTGRGGWNNAVAKALSDHLVGSVQTQGHAQAGAGVVTVWCDCASIGRIGLSQALIASVLQWQNVLKAKFWKNGRYVYSSVPTNRAIFGKAVLTVSQAKNIIKATALTQDKLTTPQKAAVAASAVGGSYLAWEIVRRLITGGV